MNLPNILTVSRIFLTGAFLFFLFSAGVLSQYIALLLFIAASITDFLDGRLARKRGITSTFGIIMDPIADKVLVLSSFFAFVYLQIIPAWMVVIIVIREVVITGIRLCALSTDQALPASRSGKHKTVSQIVSIIVILLFLCIRETVSTLQGSWPSTIDGQFRTGIFIVMCITVALTLFSGARFMIKNREKLSLMSNFIKSVATVFGAGYMPKAPGLMGSLVGFGIWFITKEAGILYTGIAITVTGLGFLVCGKAEEIFGEKDCQKIVIDETSGMLIVLLGIRGPLSLAIVLFAAFRLLDVTKPGWFRRIQRAPGSIGVMGDDIAVAVFINICARLFIMLTSGITT